MAMKSSSVCALEHEKITKTKWAQYYGTPCRYCNKIQLIQLLLEKEGSKMKSFIIWTLALLMFFCQGKRYLVEIVAKNQAQGCNEYSNCLNKICD